MQLLTPEMISASDVGSSPGSSLNYTYVNATLQPLVGTTIQGVAPRWIVRCNVSAVTPEDGEPTTLSAAVLVLDTDLERSIGLASQWPYRTLNQEEVHVSASLLRALRIQPNRGQRVHLEIDIGAQLGVCGMLLLGDGELIVVRSRPCPNF